MRPHHSYDKPIRRSRTIELAAFDWRLDNPVRSAPEEDWVGNQIGPRSHRDRACAELQRHNETEMRASRIALPLAAVSPESRSSHYRPGESCPDRRHHRKGYDHRLPKP